MNPLPSYMYHSAISTRRFRVYSLLLILFAILGCERSPTLENKKEQVPSPAEREALTAQLNQIYDDDQEYRKLIMVAITEHGLHSDEVKRLGQRIDQLDSIHLKAVKSILEQYGWLGSDILGSKANSALFLVIQHADLQTRSIFLPAMREAVKNHSASAQDLAKLEDRVAIDQGEKQLYGTQFGFDDQTETYYLLPLVDPEGVDERRGKMGLIPMALHLSQWQIDWNPNDYN